MPDVVVIGGGLAGIAATAALKSRGVDVQQLIVGQTPPSITWDAQHGAVTKLMQMIGVGVERAPSSTRYVVRDGKLCAIDASPRALLSSSALSLRDRVALAAEPVRVRVRPRQFGEDVSVAAFFRHHLGRQLTERVVRPIVAGTFFADPDKLSMRSCFPRLLDLERERGSVLAGALRELLGSGDVLAATMQVETAVHVDELRVGNGAGVQLLVQDGGAKKTIDARCVVVATDAPTAARLTGQQELLAIEHARVGVVRWSGSAPPGVGYFSPTGFGGVFHRDGSITSFVDEPGDLREIQALLGARRGASPRPTGEHETLSIPLATLGHAERLLAIKAAQRAYGAQGAGKIARVVFAGDYFGGCRLVDAVESGFVAAAEAEEIVRKLESKPVVVPQNGAVASQGAASRLTSGASQGAGPPGAVHAAANGAAGAAPIVVVGASYRDAATELRARLAAAEQGADAPSKQLVSAGYADGVVVLETCSRVEWIVSSARPQWAADILKSALLTRVPEARVHVRAGHAAVHYMMRVAMGLDSVAEGEPAVGRQLVLAFEKAHREGAADRALRLCWRAVQQLMGERRKRGVVRHGIGVQTLVVEELEQRGISKSAPVAVLGQGEIGKAVVNALNDAGFSTIATFRRDSRARLDEFAKECAAVIVCTGAPAAHAVLPARRDAPLVVDVGVPAQIASAPGWISVSLEDLLAHPRRLLDDETRAWLVDQVGLGADRLAKDLSAPAPAGALSVIDEERRIFLRETLPPLLEKLPSSSAEEVRRACTAFAHTLMERVREEGAS